MLLAEVLSSLQPLAGASVVDCTLGFGGHAAALLAHAGPDGQLVGFDLDEGNLANVRERLDAVGNLYSLHHANFAAIEGVLAVESAGGADALLADLGMSSIQVDDADRGFSYMRDGPLDMRMDRTRGKTAAELLATLPADELAAAFRELGDEPQADAIAAAVVESRTVAPLERTTQLRDLIQLAAPVKVEFAVGKKNPSAWQQRAKPAARVFQALRILVNRELASLTHLLRVLPRCLKPGGRAAIISFHSGEDRLVKAAFKEGHQKGVYSQVSDEPIRASSDERYSNPRSRSAKMRVAVRAS